MLNVLGPDALQRKRRGRCTALYPFLRGNGSRARRATRDVEQLWDWFLSLQTRPHAATVILCPLQRGDSGLAPFHLAPS
eukprot:scaffold2377_cov376-Prasinococcus_capsulatus_cf.AAC.1